ncbi:MAG: FAD-dependent oxidoreductase, partial [Granulosicoccus sp.]
MTSREPLVTSQRNRLHEGGRIDRATELQFSFNGKSLTGYQGDTLASAMLANDVSVVGRSFKYARARGIMCAGVEEPNAIMQIGASAATQTPNVKATEQSLYQGLVCRSVNGWPSVEHDVMGLVGKFGGAVMAPGFYYKTFMWPKTRWESYEKLIRKAAGLGRSPSVPDEDCYDHMHQHADVCVIGAGPAGLMAALAAARSGARVLLADERSEPGGSLLHSAETIEGQHAMQWVADAVRELVSNARVTLLSRSTVNGCHDHNFLTISERRTDHLADSAAAGMSRQRLHKVRAGSVVLASGAHERPLVFANNDLPGCMVASAVSHYIHRFAVVPGKELVVVTTNDAGYQCAFDWHSAGRRVVAIVDTRSTPGGAVTEYAKTNGIRVLTGQAVIEARGSKRVTYALVAPVNADASSITGKTRVISCDTIASSGGWSPVVHLSCHTGARPVWSDEAQGFLPAVSHEQRWFAGSVNGKYRLHECLADGLLAGRQASIAAGFALADDAIAVPQTSDGNDPGCESMAVFHLPHTKPCAKAPKQFVDMQNDVTAAGIQMTVSEGFESIEHVKRYTALGFGTDQGKTGNINGMAVVAKALGKTIAETGTTVFRPNYTPVSFGVVAGAHTGTLFDPERLTPMHAWHKEMGAEFENVG